MLTDMVHLVVSDGDNEAGAEIMVNVAPVNDPPIVAPIPDQVGMEDVPWTIDVSSYVSDVDSPFETLFLTLDSAYVTTSGMELTLIYPDGITEDRVSLSVSDGRDVTIAEINVTVLPVNDPPVVGEVPKLNLTEDEPLAFDMRPYLFDIDDPVEELTLWLDSPFVSMEGHILIMVYPDGVLTDRLTVVVSDGKDEVEVSLVIEVEPVNDAPVVADIPPLTVVEDEPFTFDVGPFISDMDTPVSALTLWINSPFVRHNHHVIELQYPDGVVYDEVLVQVWDRDLQGNTTLRVTVVPVNDPPWWYAPPNIRGVEDVEGEFDLGPFISDIDTHDDMLVVEDNTPYGWMDNHVFRFLYPDGIVTDVVTFTLTDGQFHVDLELGVTIAPVNDPPELTGASVDPSLGDAGTLFRFSVVVRDIDAGHVVPVVVVVIDGVEHRCTIDGSDTGGFVEGAFFYVDLKLPRGEHSFTFRAEDGDGGSSKTAMLTLTVTPEAGPDSMPGWMELLVSSFTIGVALVGALILIKRRSTKRTGA
ncbi:MAG: hypothetical protein GWN97_22115 [Thermoplasmata archaeon]|nr:hypothetical protein [Thermoplasmata archaeon]